MQQPRVVGFAIIAALAFWMPDVLVHWIAGREFSGAYVIIITLMLPITFLIAYAKLRPVAVHRGYNSLCMTMLFGVWLTGGLFMMIAATATGGGFTGPNGLRESIPVIAVSVIPVYTCIMATYDGSLVALLAVTVIPLLVFSLGSSGKSVPFLGRSK